MNDLIITGVICCLFIIFGILLSLGKCAWLIAGYNDLPTSEKERYDKMKLCRSTSHFLIVCTVCILCMSVFDYLQLIFLFRMTSVILVISIIWMLFRGILAGTAFLRK